MPRKGEKGFTLIELLIVVAIIGILAAIAILQFAAHRERAIEGSMISDVRNAATAVAALHTDALTYNLLSVSGGPGPGTATWQIAAVVPPGVPGTYTAPSTLSRGNAAGVVTGDQADAFTIRIDNTDARDGRRRVTIDQAGAISWMNP